MCRIMSGFGRVPAEEEGVLLAVEPFGIAVSEGGSDGLYVPESKVGTTEATWAYETRRGLSGTIMRIAYGSDAVGGMYRGRVDAMDHETFTGNLSRKGYQRLLVLDRCKMLGYRLSKYRLMRCRSIISFFYGMGDVMDDLHRIQLPAL
jgi:hypothetical protein